MSTQTSDPSQATGKASPKVFVPQDIVYLMTLGGAIFYGFASKFSENTPGWVQVLFGLPVAAQFIGGAFHVKRAKERGDKHREFFNFSMSISTLFIGAYCILWIIYTNGYKQYQVFSWLALFIIAVLVGLVGYMMCAFLQVPDGNRWPNLTQLRNGAAAEPLWAMSFLFFVIFLDVTFLFGFAFAFHDQHCLSQRSNSPAPALRMLNLPSDDDAITPSAATNATSPSATSNAKYYFYFDSIQAHLDRGNYENEIREQLAEDQEGNTAKEHESKNPESFAISEKCEVSESDVSPLKRSIWISRDQKLNNFCSLEQLKRRIEWETRQGNRTRVVLIGRADDRPIATDNRRLVVDSPPYKSNYELSEARAENVRYEIVQTLKKDSESGVWHNLEWLTLPSSNEISEPDDELGKILNSQPGLPATLKEQIKEKNKRVVEATIVSFSNDITSLQMKELSRRQFRELNLMDYMYFSIYTITTTGYGDIIPTTGYAKFLISIANICEVLFLVVFFNALVSIKSTKKEEEQNNGEEIPNVTST